MLLDITVSPCSRVTMFLYMLMQIIARLLAFQVRLIFSCHATLINLTFNGTVYSCLPSTGARASSIPWLCL